MFERGIIGWFVNSAGKGALLYALFFGVSHLTSLVKEGALGEIEWVAYIILSIFAAVHERPKFV